MSRPATERTLAWVAMALAGALALVLAGRSGDHAAAARAVGYALLAAVGVSLLLRGTGRRVVAALGLVLAVGLGLLVALGEGHPGLWAACALGVAGSLLQLVRAGRWGSSAARYRRTAPAHPATDLDVWKALDAGLDPTADDFGDSLSPREDSPVVTTRKPHTAPRGPDQEDQ